MKHVYALVLCAAFTSAQAQLVVTDSLTTSTIAQLLEGLNVSITNLQVNCPQEAMGHFTGISELDIVEGIVLTTGSADLVSGGVVGLASGYLGSPGDSDLEAQVQVADTYDACVLEFDCIPLGDTLLFNFSFGSEEYPEFVGTPFNDVFAIFLTGPGFPLPVNVAALPDGTPVAINNVNASSQTSYFVDNVTGNGLHVSYDGFTTNLTAFAVVEPDASYHFKVAIADVADQIYDSGVFLEAFSFRSVSLLTTGVHEAQPRLMSRLSGEVLEVVVPAEGLGAHVELLDLGGRLVHRTMVQEQRVIVDMGAMPDGVYIVRVPQLPALAPIRLVKG